MSSCTTRSGKMKAFKIGKKMQASRTAMGKKIFSKRTTKKTAKKTTKKTTKSGRIPVGAKVVLAPGWETCEDAAKGPLKVGDVGIVRLDDETSKPYKVSVRANTWWCVDACRVVSLRFRSRARAHKRSVYAPSHPHLTRAQVHRSSAAVEVEVEALDEGSNEEFSDYRLRRRDHRAPRISRRYAYHVLY